ncbi:MAG: L-rhamnose isomerase [Lentisphaeria bacterium]|nr:L-rhamnose isomerase [Lentisphaeria bacterium]
MNPNVELAYKLAKERYAEIGVDTDAVLNILKDIPVSVHCWQADDVMGFEVDQGASGGILCTGNYPGRARTPEELRADLDQFLTLMPGTIRLNLHAIYRESETFVDRAKITPEHFKNWIDWAKQNKIGLDFNPTYFSHPNASDGLTLSHPDKGIRDYWIEHGIACREIAAAMGKELGNRCVMNTWIPDGFKDTPVDRFGARKRLVDSLDQIFAKQLDPKHMRDAVESKLFGIGVESCTVGSNEFYLAYAVKNNLMLTLDSGHFHPTEVISDKLSSALLFTDEILLHVSRPVRWDSDHVVTFDDELQQIASEIVRCDAVKRVNIGLDYFDATINRMAAWVIGTRNMQKALCKALLEPAAALKKMEETFNYTERLAMLEELKAMPWQAVYDYFCAIADKPVGSSVMQAIRKYENDVQSKRG